jgi:hypothetical protein
MWLAFSPPHSKPANISPTNITKSNMKSAWKKKDGLKKLQRKGKKYLKAPW